MSCHRPVAALLALAAALPAADQAAPVDDVALADDAGYVEAVSRRRQRIETAPQAVAVIDAADMVNTPAVTIPDRLRYLPGVDVYQSRHGQYDVGFNGWNGLLNNRMLVVQDGQEYRQEEFGAVSWIGTIGSSDVRRIEVVKGPASVTYGANAFGGVVAIQERQADDQHRAYGVGYVADPTIGDVDATALGPLGKRFYYKVSAGGTRLDDLESVESGYGRIASGRSGWSGDSDTNAGRYRATLGARLPYEHRFEVTARGYNQTVWDLVDDLDTGTNATNTKADDVIVAVRGPVLDLSWRHHTADKTYQNQKAFYVPRGDYKYIQAGFDDVDDTIRGQVNIATEANTLSFGGEWDHWRSRSNLWGGRYQWEDTWKEVSTVNGAGFVEDQLQLSPRLALTGGVRADHHSVVGLHWSPRVAVNWIPDKEQFVVLSWSSGYRLPSPIEAFISQYYFGSSPSLDAERVNALQLSWKRRHRTIDLEYGAGAFGSRANGLILPMPLSGAEAGMNFARWYATGPDITRQPGPFMTYQNLDNPVLTGGLEGQARGRLASWPLWLWGNATWQGLRFRDDVQLASSGFRLPNGATLYRFNQNLGDQPIEPPRFKANLGLDLDHGHVFGSLVGRMVSGRGAYSLANSSVLYDSYVDQRNVEGYIACDTSLGWRFTANRANFLRLAVLDLFDTGHYEVLESPGWVLYRDQEVQGQSSIGRSIALQGGFEF